jgi:hypothetical protein
MSQNDPTRCELPPGGISFEPALFLIDRTRICAYGFLNFTDSARNSGTDAAHHIRISNPVLQRIKFDPNGDHIRRWTPELRLHDSKVKRYPERPIVERDRQRTLLAYRPSKQRVERV